ncbi:hypothetical protein PCE1_004255 [Barthelona sp. PCE]
MNNRPRKYSKLATESIDLETEELQDSSLPENIDSDKFRDFAAEIARDASVELSRPPSKLSADNLRRPSWVVSVGKRRGSFHALLDEEEVAKSVQKRSATYANKLTSTQKLQRKFFTILKKLPNQRSDKDIDLIMRVVSSLQFFDSKDPITKRMLCLCVQHRILKQGEVLFRKGDAPDFFYVVYEGTVAVQIPKETAPGEYDHSVYDEVGLIQTGGSFGELALLRDAPRAATIVAHKNSVLLRIHKNQYNDLICASKMNSFENRVNFFSSLSCLESLDDNTRSALAEVSEEISFDDAKCIISQDSPPNGMYFVAQGEVICVSCVQVMHELRHLEVGRLVPGEFYGQYECREAVPFKLSLVCHSSITLLFVPRADLLRLVPMKVLLKMQQFRTDLPPSDDYLQSFVQNQLYWQSFREQVVKDSVSKIYKYHGFEKRKRYDGVQKKEDKSNSLLTEILQTISKNNQEEYEKRRIKLGKGKKKKKRTRPNTVLGFVNTDSNMKSSVKVKRRTVRKSRNLQQRRRAHSSMR